MSGMVQIMISGPQLQQQKQQQQLQQQKQQQCIR
jgi:hypothetical protein